MPDSRRPFQEAEQALRATEERLCLVTRAVAGMVYDWDLRTDRVERFQGLFELLGFHPEEAEPVVEWWRRRVHPEDRARIESSLNARLAEGIDSFNLEYRVLHRDGRYLYVWERGITLRDERGKVVRVIGSTMDMTDRKNAEEELLRAKQQAEEASRAKDRFLATLSHELRTPLTPVLAVVSALTGDPRLPEDVRRALAMARHNVELEARLIDDLLDLTRVTRGKLELHREIADLRPVLDHAILMSCGQEVAVGRIHLVTDLAAESHRIWGDASRLSQVFWNLLKNAVKFTPSGGTVTVRTWNEGSDLAIEVSDTGIGIDPEVLPRIFDAFEQVDRRITRRYGGLGLGLSISRTLVELHGGSLAASSAGPGEGAAFTVRLPAALPAAAEEAAPPDEHIAEPAEARSLRILLVEDHLDTAEAMADLLRARGHQVTVAMDIGRALAAAAAAGRGGFDLVVSDLGLPDGSGHDLMRELVERYDLQGIALSGYGMDDDIRRSLEAGFSRHLTKPVSPQTLDTAIRQTAARGEEKRGEEREPR